MASIRSFRDLEVYRISLEGARRIFIVTMSFPREERYALVDQIRRSSRAVNGLIAEGWGRRRYRAAFINKMSEAIGEASETQAWLDHALICEYIDIVLHGELDATWRHVGAMLHRIMQRADDFCRSAAS